MNISKLFYFFSLSLLGWATSVGKAAPDERPAYGSNAKGRRARGQDEVAVGRAPAKGQRPLP